MCSSDIWSKIAVRAAAGGDAVHHDVVVGHFLAQRLGQRNDPGLGGGIGRRVGVAFLARDGGDIDDAAIARVAHQRADRAAAEPDAGQVDLDDLAPFVGRIVPDRAVGPGDAGIVDLDVDTAQRTDGLFHCRIHRLGIRHIDTDGGGPDLAGRRAGEVHVAVPERHLRAGGDETLRHRAPDPLCAARHHGPAASQVDHVHNVPPPKSVWLCFASDWSRSGQKARGRARGRRGASPVTVAASGQTGSMIPLPGRRQSRELSGVAGWGRLRRQNT